MKTKKLISVICALAMSCSIMSGAVIANAEDTTEEVVETVYAAYIGETPYETLDAALAFVNENRDASYTITLNADQELTTVNSYSGAGNTTTITSDDTRRKITLNPASNGSSFIWDIVKFDNVEVVSSTTCENSLWFVAAYQGRYNRYFTVQDSYLHNITVTDCLSAFTQNNVINSTIENNSAPAAIFANRIDSLIDESTITNNTATNLGAVEVVGGTTTIRNSTVTGTISNRGDVSASGGTLRLEGSTTIGSIYKGNGAITLASDFTGSADIKFASGVAVGTTVATVEEGASVDGITVQNMPEGTALAVVDGALVVCEVVTSANLEDAEWATTDESYTYDGNKLTKDDETVYGYKATLTNDGTTRNGVTAKVTNVNGATNEKSNTTVISDLGDVVFYILSTIELNTSASTVSFN